jgi:putative effector of murein hydrolase
MTFPSVPKGLPAKLCLLLLVSALFTRAAVSATLHPRSAALAFVLQRHGGSGASAAVLVAIIGVIGTIIAAFISSRRGKS